MSEITSLNDLEQIGLMIRNKRESLHLTQEEVAERADLSWDTIHRIELGKTSVKIDMSLHVCDALGANPYDFLPSRYRRMEDADDLHMQVSRLNKCNPAFLKKQIGEMIFHLLKMQGVCDS